MMWMKKAACRGLPIDLFMPKRGEVWKIKDARAICRECPVINDCREYSLDAAQSFDLDGIFGGWTKNERINHLRKIGLSVRRVGAGTIQNTNMKRQVVKIHGTETAYRNHLANKETPCDECREQHEARNYRTAMRQRRRK